MISVVMALYNGEKYIKEQIESILNQTVSVQEIVICDDCSADASVNIVNEIIKTAQPVKIRLIKNKENLGYIRNFYKGICESQGNIIFLADQDDIWMPNKVEKMLDVMHKYDAELLCSNFELIDQYGNKSYQNYQIPDFLVNAPEGISKISLNVLIYGNVAQGCTYCFTKKVRELYLKIDNHEVIHDYQLMLIAAAMDKAYIINEKLIKYRLHGDNSVGFKTKKDLSHIKFRFPFHKPKVAKIIEYLRPYIKLSHYIKYEIILYFRIPVIRALINRLKKCN